MDSFVNIIRLFEQYNLALASFFYIMQRIMGIFDFVVKTKLL